MLRGILAAILMGLAIYFGLQVSKAQQNTHSDNTHSDEEREICLGQNSYT